MSNIYVNAEIQVNAFLAHVHLIPPCCFLVGEQSTEAVALPSFPVLWTTLSALVFCWSAKESFRVVVFFRTFFESTSSIANYTYVLNFNISSPN